MSVADAAPKRPTVSAEEGGLLSTVRNLWQYMWPAGRPDLKLRVILAIGALLVSKVATTLVPFLYKWIIDSLDGTTPDTALVMGIAVSIVLVIAFGVGNIIDAGFQQLRQGLRQAPAVALRDPFDPALQRVVDIPQDDVVHGVPMRRSQALPSALRCTANAIARRQSTP